MKMHCRAEVEDSGSLVAFLMNCPSEKLNNKVEVNLDGYTFDIDYIELDTDDVIRIHLKK